MTPLHLLIVDDDAANRRLMLRMLANTGMRVEEAASGAAAIALAMKTRHDIIFLDISMPAIGGITVARSIRRHYGDDVPRLIACTAHHYFGADRNSEEGSHFDAVLTKPFVRADLLRVIGAHS